MSNVQAAPSKGQVHFVELAEAQPLDEEAPAAATPPPAAKATW